MRRLAIASLFAVTLTSGCSAPSLGAEQAWAAEFDEARQIYPAAFPQAAFADNHISDAELQEAKQRFISCMDAAGFPGTTFDERGIRSIPNLGQTDAQYAEADNACDDETGLMMILYLHKEPRQNPDNIDWGILIADCLVRKGVVEAGFSAADYNAATDRMEADAASGQEIDVLSYYPFVVDAETAETALIDCEDKPAS